MGTSTNERTADDLFDVEVENTDTLLTTSEVASLLHTHTNTIRRWSNHGILPSFRIGPRGDRRFSKEKVFNSDLIFKQIGVLQQKKEWSGMDGTTSEQTVDEISDVDIEETDSLLTTSEVAKLLNIHINTVRRWTKLGVLPSFRVGPRGDRRFWKKNIFTFLER